MIDRLESFFAEDLPSSMEVLPKPEELAAPAQMEKAESAKPAEAKVEAKDDSEASSAFSSVRLIRIAAKEAIARCQDAYQEIETGLKKRAEELDRRQAALSSASEAASAGLQELQRKIGKDLADEMAKVSQPLLAHSSEQLQGQTSAAISALQEKLDAEKQRFVAETEKQFETLRASRELFIDETQKQTAATAQAAVDSLTKTAAEKRLSSLDALAKEVLEKALCDLDESRRLVVSETQAELAAAGKASLEPLTKDLSRDLIEEVRAELAASRQSFVDETQAQLAQMIQASQQVLRSFVATTVEQANADLMSSHKQVLDDAREQVATMARATLESEIKGAVEHGRKELRDMVDAFLAKAVPQIETELERLVSRRTEALHAQPVVPLTTPVRAPSAAAAVGGRSLGLTTSQIAAARAVEERLATPIRPGLSNAGVVSRGRGLEFKLAESARNPRVERHDLWEGISSGLKLGIALGLVALIGFLIYFFATPVIRLRSNPPAAFFDDSQSLSAKQRAQDNDLARAYWKVAVTNIQAQYGFGSTLPADPPETFKIEKTDTSGETAAVDPAARARYWERLRELWPQADSWERQSSEGVDWIRSAWQSASWKMNQIFSSSNASAAP
jgi:hypothetical protein